MVSIERYQDLSKPTELGNVRKAFDMGFLQYLQFFWCQSSLSVVLPGRLFSGLVKLLSRYGGLVLSESFLALP